MNTVKSVCDEYKISQRKLSILMGYSKDQVQRVNVGKRAVTLRFQTMLDTIEKQLRAGTIEIPK